METKQPCRVIIVNRFFGGSQTPTGRMAEDVARVLLADGHEVRVLASNSQYASDQNPGLPAGVRVYRLPGRRRAGRLESWSLFWLQVLFVLPFLRWNRCVVMTDPPFLSVAAVLSCLIHPRRKVYWWTMDIYPDALAASDVKIPAKETVLRVLHWLRNRAVPFLSGVVCLGQQQVLRLRRMSRWPRHEDGFCVTVPPWDLRDLSADKNDIHAFRTEMGWTGKRVILYAGNLGEAHQYRSILQVADLLRRAGRTDWHFAFFCRGARVASLKRAAAGYPNVTVSDYLDPARTGFLLNAADVHLITMDEGWSGIVVPSKLYGVLKTAAPVLFIGPEDSDTAAEIRRLNAGNAAATETAASDLLSLIESLATRTPQAEGAERPRAVAEFITS